MDNYKDHFKKMKKQKARPNPRVSLSYRSNRVRSGFTGSSVLGAICLLGFAVTLYGFLYPEKMATLASRVQISLFSASLANDSEKPAAEKSAQDPAPKEEKKSPSEDPALAGKKEETKDAVPEKPNYAQNLVDKEKELEEREKKLVEMDEKLQQEKLELDKKIEALEKARRDIASRLETRVAQDEENMTKLVGVYSNMKPQSAADVITKMDDELAVNLLKRMKKQDAANILNNIEAQRAKTLSEKYSGY